MSILLQNIMQKVKRSLRVHIGKMYPIFDRFKSQIELQLKEIQNVKTEGPLFYNSKA